MLVNTHTHQFHYKHLTVYIDLALVFDVEVNTRQNENAKHQKLYTHVASLANSIPPCRSFSLSISFLLDVLLLTRRTNECTFVIRLLCVFPTCIFSACNGIFCMTIASATEESGWGKNTRTHNTSNNNSNNRRTAKLMVRSIAGCKSTATITNWQLVKGAINTLKKRTVSQSLKSLN